MPEAAVSPSSGGSPGSIPPSQPAPIESVEALGAASLRGTLLVAAGAFLLAALLVQPGRGWRTGVVGGGGDAWQNVWNVVHVRLALSGGEPFFFSNRVWAPEGAGLASHTLSLPWSVPAAILARPFDPGGEVAGYNLALLLTFALAAAAAWRLARRLGAGTAGALVAAALFAFCPQRMGRAEGHLNLLGGGWILLSLEGLLLVSRSRGRGRRAGYLLATAGLILSALSDWYLGFLAGLGAAALVLFELRRSPAGERASRGLRFGAVALGSLLVVAPFALALRAETKAQGAKGHDPTHCCTAVTSLGIPTPIQLASRWTPSLTGRNSQNIAEGATYLGWTPLLATLGVILASAGVRRRLDFALVAGGAALVLSLGPRLRLFDESLAVPLPYELLAKLVPPLAIGGCVSRFVLLAYLPLALGLGLAVDRLLARRDLRGRGLVALLLALTAVEYAPVPLGLHPWPNWPPDPALEAIAGSRHDGLVLDTDLGPRALVRQLRHGRPQLFGYLSRTPESLFALRLADPAVAFLLGRSPDLQEDRVEAIRSLRLRWKVGFVVATPSSPEAARVEMLGIPPFAESDRTKVWQLRLPRRPPLPAVELAAERPEVELAGFHGVETVGIGGGTASGRWSSARAQIRAPLAAGRWRIRLEAPRPAPIDLSLAWGEGKKLTKRIETGVQLLFDVAEEDLDEEGCLTLKIESSPFRPPGDKRELGVFVVGISRAE
jgi:hypothetical protein